MGKHSFFPRLALVNMVRNSRYYGPYLLSCGALAAMYYILRFLTWNEVIQTVRGAAYLQVMMSIGCFVVASSKMRRAKERVEHSRPYFETLYESLTKIAAADPRARNPYLRREDIKRTLLVVIAGDRGLAGGYNANVFKQADAAEGPVTVLPIGKRSAEYFAHHGAGLFTPEVLMAADVSVSECFTLSHQITEGFLKGEYDAVKLCYTRFDSMMTQTATTLEVLPLTIEPTEAQKAEARRSQILYKPSCEEVFGAIIPEYVAGVLYGAVCESVASELAARRTAMDAATKNAGEMIEHLNLYYNRARQAAITQEITEIVAGAEN